MRSSEPHPAIQAVLEETEDAPEFNEVSVEQARAIVEDMFSVEDPLPIGDVIERSIDGPSGDLPIRIYVPEGEDPFAVLTFFHGGGFVTGGLDSYDQFCRGLADKAGVIVVSIDYRLAPENPFPAAVEDAYVATKWVSENAQEFGGDPNRHGVAGESAGGNLAAVVTHMAQKEGTPDLTYQLLMYPVVSYEQEWPSYEENGEGYLLTKRDIEWFADHYLENDIHAVNPYASPVRSRSFSDLPPATVVTAGFDPFRDEGAEYANRLKDADVDVNHRHYEDVIHVFLMMATKPFELPPSKEAMDDVVDDLVANLK